MRIILLIILGFIALSIAATLIGPMIVLGIGAVLAYYAYKNLLKPNKSVLNIIWWGLVGVIGVNLFVGILPGFVFIAAIAALAYFVFRKTNPKVNKTDPNQSSLFNEYESFEAEWHDITNR
jgi:lia operon protein LiaI